MKINFFEEYPTKENLAKLDLVTWPATVFIASSSYEKFNEVKNEYIKKYENITFGWWPTISESYWISGISNPKNLEGLFNELTNNVHSTELTVLLDLELPRKPWKYIKNLIYLKSNKKKITDFLKQAQKNNIRVYTAEYPSTAKILSSIYKTFGLSPSFDLPHTKIPMCYSSMIKKFLGKKKLNHIKKFEQKLSQENPNRINFGLGTIATGVLGNEPICSTDNLKEDLIWAKESGAGGVFIFRLGGMTEEYKNICLDYLN